MNYIEAGIEVIKLIEMNGYEAFFVGGFVRDYLLGVTINDIDITTNALPSQIANIFKVVNTGIKYNSVVVEYEGYSFETTTYRLEGAYLDYRHPTYEAGKVLSDDLRRRDFTINAMAMNKDMEVVDIFGGLNDLKNEVIKTVNDPQKRFTEDALRMLRAAYFASKLGFSIESETLLAMRKCSYLVQNLSLDRITWELEKLISSKYQEKGIGYLIETNIAPYLGHFKNAIYLYREKKFKCISWPLFVAISYFDNLDDLSLLHLKNNLNNQIKSAILLAKRLKKNNFDRIDLFDEGEGICLLANDINLLLFGSKDKSCYIKKEYKLLPIHGMSELMINGNDILDNVIINDKRDISIILKDIKRLVLLEKLDNDKECILKYIKKHY